MKGKPKLTKQLTAADFKNHYWLKTELVSFCKTQKLLIAGSKQELAERIEVFLATGHRHKPVRVKKNNRDSDQLIQMNTLVQHYNNDTVTRQFFISQIGEHFHFNRYLRQFTNKNNITLGLTYGDLVAGWLAEESKKNNPQYKTKIDKQFEYNQFVRDFYANEKRKSHSEVVKAWKMLKSLAGPKTYANYHSILKRKKTC